MRPQVCSTKLQHIADVYSCLRWGCTGNCRFSIGIWCCTFGCNKRYLLPWRIPGKRYSAALRGLAVLPPECEKFSPLRDHGHQCTTRHQHCLYRFHSPCGRAVPSVGQLAGRDLSIFRLVYTAMFCTARGLWRPSVQFVCSGVSPAHSGGFSLCNQPYSL